MKCTRCNGELIPAKLEGIPVEKCHSCYTFWLHGNELETFENIMMVNDEYEGSITLGNKHSMLKCPVCGNKMKKIIYCFNELDICPEYCGLYLEAAQEKRIKEIINSEKISAKRKVNAKKQWTDKYVKRKHMSVMENLTKTNSHGTLFN